MSTIYKEGYNELHHIHTLQLLFPNGMVLSLAWGGDSPSTESTVEVGVFDRYGPRDEWLTCDAALLAGFGSISRDEEGEEVDGYCDADRVHGYLLAVQELDRLKGVPYGN